jgi:hypothetical protein
VTRHLLAGACLLVVALVWAWPLVTSLTTAFPGGPKDLDVATMVWNVGYIHRQLAQGGDLLTTRSVLVPFGADLRLHTYALLHGLAVSPLVGWLGVVGAYNVALLATLALNGWLAYALIYTETRHAPAALIGATCLMLASSVLFQVRVGRPAFASLWIVAGALLAARAILLGRAGLLSGVVLGLLLVSALLADFQVMLFTGLWLALYGLYQARALVHPIRLAAMGLALAIVALPLTVVFGPALVDAEAAGFPRPTLDDMQVYAFRVWDYVTPETIADAHGFEYLLAVPLAVMAPRRRGEQLWVWLIGAVVFLVLALGPYLEPTRTQLPFALFGQLSPLAQFRTPSRLVMPAVLGLSVVLGYALAALLPRLRRPRLIAAVVVAAVGARLMFAVMHDPLRVQTYPAYATYAAIAAEGGSQAILEVPFGVRSGLERIGQGGEALSVYQAWHGRPVLNAMVARLPGWVFQAYREHPSLMFLSGEPVATDFAPDFADVLELADVGVVLVHRSWLDARQVERIVVFLDGQARLKRQPDEQDLLVYRVV